MIVDPSLLHRSHDRLLDRLELLAHLLGRHHHRLLNLSDLLFMLSLDLVRCAQLHGFLVSADAHLAIHLLGHGDHSGSGGGDHSGCATRRSASAVASVADSRHSAAGSVP